jgi:hypothetical protein
MCEACANVETCEDLAEARDWLSRNYIGGFDNNPGNVDSGVTIDRRELAWSGVNLLSCAGRGCEHGQVPGERFGALLVDMDGNFLQGWDINGIPAKLLPGGKIMGGHGGGFGGSALVMQDWYGEELWRWTMVCREDHPEVDCPDGVNNSWHHDHNRKNSPNGSYAPGQKPKDEGKTLVVVNHNPGVSYDYPKGWLHQGHPAFDTSHIFDDLSVEGMDDAIYIVDKKGRIKWQWFSAQAFDQMGFSEKAKDAVKTACVGRGCRRGQTDWSHINNANWLGPNDLYGKDGDERFHPDNIIYDSRSTGMIGILAHDDHPRGDWKKGDLIWQVGPQFGEGTPWAELGVIIGPHNAQMIPKDLPGEGNIIVFDNGGRSNYGPLDYGDITDCDATDVGWPAALRDYSRILEFDPRAYEVVWEYIASSLPGGPGVIGRALYRAYRYPVSWLPGHVE